MNKPYSNNRIVTELNQLNDVEITNPSSSQSITYNGSNWTNSTSISFSETTNNTNIANKAPGKSIRIGYMSSTPPDDNTTTIAIGTSSGMINCGCNSICIGEQAGFCNRGSNSVAIGIQAGFQKFTGVVNNTVAIGAFAGTINQGDGAVAIGSQAGSTNQAANSIVINATGSILNNATASALVIKPIRQVDKGFGNINGLYYNSTTGEITWSAT